MKPDRIPFYQPYVSEEIYDAVREVLERGRQTGSFTVSEETTRFEKAFADYNNIKHAISMNSCTAALHAALMAYGIGKGDEVIVPSLTFIATFEAVWFVGARPVVVDVDPKYYVMDVEQAISEISRKTKAIIPVHLYGHPVDMDPIMEAAKKKDIVVIEDNAQAPGGRYKERMLGTIGSVGCFSFHPQKNITTLGDGGLLTTNDDEIAEKVMMIRDHGRRRGENPYSHEVLGHNFRMGEMKAAIGRVALSHLDDWNRRRREIAARYRKALNLNTVTTPEEASWAYHVYHLYVVRCANRDKLKNYLRTQNIMTEVHYPIPCHKQKVFEKLEREAISLPISERLAGEILSLPMFPELTDDKVDYVVSKVKEFYDQQ